MHIFAAGWGSESWLVSEIHQWGRNSLSDRSKTAFLFFFLSFLLRSSDLKGYFQQRHTWLRLTVIDAPKSVNSDFIFLRSVSLVLHTFCNIEMPRGGGGLAVQHCFLMYRSRVNTDVGVIWSSVLLSRVMTTVLKKMLHSSNSMEKAKRISDSWPTTMKALKCVFLQTS